MNQEKNAIRKACSSDVEAMNLNHKLHFYSIFLIKKKKQWSILNSSWIFPKKIDSKNENIWHKITFLNSKRIVLDYICTETEQCIFFVWRSQWKLHLQQNCNLHASTLAGRRVDLKLLKLKNPSEMWAWLTILFLYGDWCLQQWKYISKAIFSPWENQ